MAGITRIAITDRVGGPGSSRFRHAKRCWPANNAVYRQVFAGRGMPLAAGEESIEIPSEEFAAGYDAELAIDVILRFQNGMKATLQEKNLRSNYQTVTVEYMQDPTTGEEGDWFNFCGTYYFVAYDRFLTGNLNDWILLNWSLVQQATLQGKVDWKYQKNKRDGARANFRYEFFNNFPASCVVAIHKTGVVAAGHLIDS